MSTIIHTTFITTLRISIPQVNVPQVRLPNPGFGKTLETLVLILGEAFGSVYAAPFNSHLCQRPAGSEQDF